MRKTKELPRIIDVLETPERGETAIVKVGNCFPTQEKQIIVKSNLNVMSAYQWALPQEKAKALEHVRAMANSVKLGFPRQAQLHYEKAEDCMLFDYSNKAIQIAEKNGLKLKPLAKLSENPGQSFHISGTKHKWEFKLLESYGKLVPPVVLEMASKVRNLGLRWGKAYIGEPYVPAYTRIRDPILGVSIGRWVLEIARWV